MDKNLDPGFKLPRAEDMPAGSKSFLRWLWFFIAPYKRTAGFFALVRLVRFTYLGTLPLAIGRVINAFESGWAFEHPQQMLLAMIGYFAVYTVFSLTIWVFYAESIAEDRMIRGLTLYSVKHMNALPLQWHEAQGSGGKLQRVMTARASLKHLYRLYKWYVMPFLGTVTAVVISLALIDAPGWFMLLFAGMVVSFFAAAWLLARRLTPLHDRHNTALENMLAGVYEFVSAIRTVKSFHMGDYIERRALDLEGSGHGAMRNVIGAVFMKWTVLNAVAMFWVLMIVTACVTGIYQHWLSVGAFATCFFMAQRLWTLLEDMVYIQDEVIEARNGFLRLSETLSVPVQNLDLAPLQELPRAWEAISFEDVSFAYSQEAGHALRDISLSIRRGEKIALVGKSGAGKSTLVRLLMKQMWPGGGAVRAGGIDLRHIDSGSWLGAIGYVPQDVELFNMSIRDNILLDRMGDVSESDYRRAVEQAALAEFVASLPDGDVTMVGERGVKLSGGQRQRLGIARALVRGADLIIFDEATSSLDSLSEDAIRQAIENSFAGRTLVLIAHRLSTVKHVDRIFVLEDGRLIEEGGFDELLARGGRFAQLWAMQSGHYGEAA
ncbi:MAG TPA: ABC transporter ATP-binding protein [Alphaproteobacteria bacterium]